MSAGIGTKSHEVAIDPGVHIVQQKGCQIEADF